MTTTLRFVVALGACILSIRCAAPAVTPTAAPEPEPEPTVTAPAPTVARADALLADMARREAAYKEFERTAPPPPPPPTLDAQATVPAIPAPVVSTTAPVPVGAIEPVKDEAWWKDRMRVLKARLDADRFELAAAERSIDSASLRLTQDQAIAERNRLRAAVAADLSAIESLELEARRAGIPPGWLRP